MSELRKRLDQVSSGLEGLVDVQHDYDEVGWHIQNPASAKLRHIVLHLTATIGKLSAICEGQEHHEHNDPDATGEEVREALAQHTPQIAHLVTSAAQLADLAGIDLGDTVSTAFVTNAKRFAPESEFAHLG